MRRRAMIVWAVLALAGCGGPRGGTSGGAPPVANTGGDTSTPPAATTDVVVVARIIGSGPIGDGACSQRSYEIAVERAVSGELPAADKRWVHFEACGDDRTSFDFSGTGLEQGTSYTLTLRRGASANFGDDYMIVDARAP